MRYWRFLQSAASSAVESERRDIRKHENGPTPLASCNQAVTVKIKEKNQNKTINKVRPDF